MTGTPTKGKTERETVNEPVTSGHGLLLRDLLACPDCRAPLTWHETGIDPCPGCGRTFRTAGGVPLLHPSSGRTDEDDGRQFFIEEPGRMTQLAARHPRLARLIALPDFLSPVNALPQCRQWFHNQVRLGVPGRRVLNLGSGVEKVYANPGLINFDIAPHGNVHLVGNGERLPIRDAVLDGVVIDAVIEHLAHPQRVVAEILRVLKPGGEVLAQVPFLYPFHAAPHDYQRFTPAGLRVLFEEFEVLEAGSDRRPGRAMLEVLSAYAAVFSDRPAVAYAMRWLTAYIWLPVKLFDPWLSRKAKADTVVAACAILARKRGGE
jgi:SAM-dependent methyltransferase/uncharacterized protein YbaR (Trm112 family)